MSKPEINIQKIDNEHEILPYELLYLADPSRESIDDYLARGHCYVGFFDQRVIGVYVLLDTRPHTIEIVNVAVDPEFQNKGIGKYLVMDAIKQAKQLGAKTIEIGTGNSSIQQLALYQKCGFRVQSIDHDYFVRHYAEEIFENGIRCRDMVRLSMDL